MAVLPFLATSCKKKVVADFGYYIYTTENGAKIVTENRSSNADYYLWNLMGASGFFDSNEKEPSFSISKSGDYTLQLYAENSKYNDYKEVRFSVTLNGDGGGGSYANPVASFNLTSNNCSYAPATITCVNTSTNAVSYHWTLTRPDYTTSTSSSTNPSFTCNQTGNYTIKLTAYNANNVSATSTKTFTLSAPTSVTITYLSLYKIPMLDSDNSSWDTGTFGGADPDIFFKIVNSSNSVLYTSATKENVTSADLPVSWYSINTTLNFGTDYYIKFYDEDGSLDPNDLMANCIFNNSYLTPGNSSYTWESTDGTIKFTVGLSWSSSKGGELEVTDENSVTAEK